MFLFDQLLLWLTEFVQVCASFFVPLKIRAVILQWSGGGKWLNIVQLVQSRPVILIKFFIFLSGSWCNQKHPSEALHKDITQEWRRAWPDQHGFIPKYTIWVRRRRFSPATWEIVVLKKVTTSLFPANGVGRKYLHNCWVSQPSMYSSDYFPT